MTFILTNEVKKSIFHEFEFSFLLYAKFIEEEKQVFDSQFCPLAVKYKYLVVRYKYFYVSLVKI